MLRLACPNALAPARVEFSSLLPWLLWRSVSSLAASSSLALLAPMSRTHLHALPARRVSPQLPGVLSSLCTRYKLPSPIVAPNCSSSCPRRSLHHASSPLLRLSPIPSRVPVPLLAAPMSKLPGSTLPVRVLLAFVLCAQRSVILCLWTFGRVGRGCYYQLTGMLPGLTCASSSRAEFLSSSPGCPASYLLCSPTSATRWCSNSSAVVILSAPTRDCGRVHRIRQRSVADSTVVAGDSFACCRASRFPCPVLARFPVRQRALSALLALILIVSSILPVSVVRRRVACAALYMPPSYIVVEAVIPCTTPTSPARSKHDLVVVPRVSKKSQESGEDEASSVVFTKCATKARTSCATQVRFVKIIQSRKRSSAINYQRKEGPWMTSTGTRSRASDYLVKLVRVSKFCYSCEWINE
jgi:hypothetical protein